MDTEQEKKPAPEQQDDDLDIVEMPLPKRVPPFTPDPRIRVSPDRRIQKPQ